MPDWAALFDAAGLEPSGFKRAPPEWIPPVFADERAAWVGGYGVEPEIPIRVEAATFRGHPVYFEILGPWTTGTPARVPSLAFRDTVAALILLAGVSLAWRNLRLGRGDRRGAFRLGSFVFTMRVIEWLFIADHTSDLWIQWSVLTRAVAWALFSGASFWAYYLAVEPYVRRLWPESIVAWSRLLAGRYRDPLVGRDVLIGLSVGFATLVLALQGAMVGGAPRLFSSVDLDALLGPRFLVASLFRSLRGALQISFLVLSLILVLRILLRRTWLVAAAFVMVLTTMLVAGGASWSGRVYALDYALIAAIAALDYVLLTRVGLLAFVGLVMPSLLMLNYPAIAPDLEAWHASSFVLPLLVVTALAVWAFHNATRGRPVFRDGVFTR